MIGIEYWRQQGSCSRRKVDTLARPIFRAVPVRRKKPRRGGAGYGRLGSFWLAGPPTGFAWQRSRVWRQVTGSSTTWSLMSSVITNAWMEWPLWAPSCR